MAFQWYYHKYCSNLSYSTLLARTVIYDWTFFQVWNSSLLFNYFEASVKLWKFYMLLLFLEKPHHFIEVTNMIKANPNAIFLCLLFIDWRLFNNPPMLYIPLPREKVPIFLINEISLLWHLKVKFMNSINISSEKMIYQSDTFPMASCHSY